MLLEMSNAYISSLSCRMGITLRSNTCARDIGRTPSSSMTFISGGPNPKRRRSAFWLMPTATEPSRARVGSMLGSFGRKCMPSHITRSGSIGVTSGPPQSLSRFTSA